MTRWLALVALLFCFAKPVAARTYSDSENGGFIILRSHYSLTVDSGGYETMFIVTSEKEVASVQARLASAEGPLTFRLHSTKLDMRLRRVDDSRLIGRLKDGRRVMVVTRAYAEKHGLY